MKKIYPRLNTSAIEYVSGVVKSEITRYTKSDCIMKRSAAIDMEKFTLEVSVDLVAYDSKSQIVDAVFRNIFISNIKITMVKTE